MMLAFVSIYAQNDSITIVNASWNKKNISDGVAYSYLHFSNGELFKSNQFISIIEIEKNSKIKLEIFPSPLLKETSIMAQEKGAFAAINGSFFKFNYEYNTKDYNSADYIRKDGKQLAPNTSEGNKIRLMYQLGALAMHNGKLYILKADELRNWEKYIQAEDILTSGPILRVAGNDETMLNSSFYITRHPRTAVGIKKNGNILLMTIDGRAKEAAGMSLAELQKLVKWLGCDYALNLDGGGSTTMYIKGFSDNGVVNHPTDNKTFDNKGERKVANTILLYNE
jgi:exopolysaccharide biosynthesis protein